MTTAILDNANTHTFDFTGLDLVEPKGDYYENLLPVTIDKYDKAALSMCVTYDNAKRFISTTNRLMVDRIYEQYQVNVLEINRFDVSSDTLIKGDFIYDKGDFKEACKRCNIRCVELSTGNFVVKVNSFTRACLTIIYVNLMRNHRQH